MKASKSQLANIMQTAWAIAKSSAVKFGGTAKQYLSLALKAAWAAIKKNTAKISYRLTGSAPYQNVEFVVEKDGKVFVGTRYNITYVKDCSIVDKNCKIELDKEETLILRKVHEDAFSAELDARQNEYDRRWEEAQKSEAAYKAGIANGTIKPVKVNWDAYNALQNEEYFSL